MMRSLTAPIWNDFTNISSGHGYGLLNPRGVDWKFFREAHCSSVERVTQQADQSDACEHNARRGHTTRHMHSLKFHHQGVEKDRQKSRQDNGDANRAGVVAEQRQQARD